MFFFIFGLIWTIISTLVLVISMNSNADTSAIIILFVFEAVGLIFLIKGLIELIRNFVTSKKGIICYGIIMNTSPTGSSVNGEAEYKADVVVYLEGENRIVNCTEKIGFKPEEYGYGSCVKLKYYKEDINFLEKNVDFNMIPIIVQNALSEYYIDKSKKNTASINSNVIYLNNNIIEVNGVKYKKMD